MARSTAQNRAKKDPLEAFALSANIKYGFIIVGHRRNIISGEGVQCSHGWMTARVKIIALLLSCLFSFRSLMNCNLFRMRFGSIAFFWRFKTNRSQEVTEK